MGGDGTDEVCNEIQSYGIARKKDERAVTRQPRQGMSNKQQLSTDATRRWLGELGELSGENQRRKTASNLATNTMTTTTWATTSMSTTSSNFVYAMLLMMISF